MREIKFRAWDGDTMFNIHSANFKKGKMSCLFQHGLDQDKEIMTHYIDTAEKSEVKIMQYTGLKDKNGKEIYFGDICRVDWGDKRYKPHNVEIKWDEEDCSIVIEGGSPMVDCKNHYEVIGNIYSNPDLLKV